jgi:hypothetical protein
LLGSLTATLAERYTTRPFDDNLTVQVCSGLVLAFDQHNKHMLSRFLDLSVT